MELVVSSVLALFIQRSSDRLFSMPPSFLYITPLFRCNVLQIFDYIKDMPLQCTLDVVYIFQSIRFI